MLLDENRSVAEIVKECKRAAVKIQDNRKNYRLVVTSSDISNRRRTIIATKYGINLRLAPEKNLDLLFDCGGPLEMQCFMYQSIESESSSFLFGNLYLFAANLKIC